MMPCSQKQARICPCVQNSGETIEKKRRTNKQRKRAACRGGHENAGLGWAWSSGLLIHCSNLNLGRVWRPVYSSGNNFPGFRILLGSKMRLMAFSPLAAVHFEAFLQSRGRVSAPASGRGSPAGPLPEPDHPQSAAVYFIKGVQVFACCLFVWFLFIWNGSIYLKIYVVILFVY